MNKHEYLTKLNKELKKLPEEERQNAIQYYMEYFADAGPENEQKVILELGHPRLVANTLLSDYAIKRLNTPVPSATGTKKNLSVLKWGILALLTSPITLPLAFCLALLVLGFCLAVLILVVGCLVCSAVGAAAGIVGCAAAVYLLVIHDPATFFLCAGLGLVGVALSILLGLSGVGLGKGAVKLMKRAITYIVERRKKRDAKKQNEKENEAIE